jgi:hypothetical protein
VFTGYRGFPKAVRVAVLLLQHYVILTWSMMYQLVTALMMLHNSNTMHNAISNNINSINSSSIHSSSTIRGKQGWHRTWKQQAAVRAAAATVSVMTVTMVRQLKRSSKGCNRCAATVQQVILLLVSVLILAVVAVVQQCVRYLLTATTCTDVPLVFYVSYYVMIVSIYH